MYKNHHFGGNYSKGLGPIFSVAAMKSELQTAKILLSPCDAEREASNEDAQKNWTSYNVKANKVIPLPPLVMFLLRGLILRDLQPYLPQREMLPTVI